MTVAVAARAPRLEGSDRVPEPPPENEIFALGWPKERLGHALELLGLRSGLMPAAAQTLPAGPPADVAAGGWIDWVASGLGLEAEAVEFSLPELARGLAQASPAVLALQDRTETRFLFLLGGNARTLTLLAPDGTRRRTEAVRAAASAAAEAPLRREIDRFLDAARVRKGRRDRVRTIMLRERLATDRVGGCWLLRLPATAPFSTQMRQEGLVRRLAGGVTLLAGVYGLEVLGWGLIGAAVLEGRLDLGWFAAWVLLLAPNLPVRLGAAWLDAGFAIDLGRLLKRRLLAGALRMNVDAVRSQGAGQLLGRVMESQALEATAVTGVMTLATAVLELLFAGWILASGAGGWRHVLALVVWLAILLGFCWRYQRRLRAWTATRLEMTHTLIEHMAGHRTRLAQEWPGRHDAAEDGSMQAYHRASRALDDSMVPVGAGATGGWALLALATMAPAILSGTAGTAQIAISLGGMTLAHRAFGGIAGASASLARAHIAWGMVAELFRAGGAPRERATPLPQPGAKREGALVDASELVFRYRAEGSAVLRRLDLRVRHGERILLEGPSGGGKSTLSAVLTGLRVPQSGLLLLDGLDRHVLGDDWHGLATAAPQFHENHILTGTLAFNLLMGRNWPASERDLEEAGRLCVELGLGALLERMPAGLQQPVGETGWQLSHGERSRVFLARALLQGASLTILDESFAALDPETLQLCLRCAADHAQTLIVIAHP